jgi:hypothetical protein
MKDKHKENIKKYTELGFEDIYLKYYNSFLSVYKNDYAEAIRYASDMIDNLIEIGYQPAGKLV